MIMIVQEKCRALPLQFVGENPLIKMCLNAHRVADAYDAFNCSIISV